MKKYLILLAISIVSLTGTSQDWQFVNPLPTGNAIHACYYNNGTWFIGGIAGTVLRSADDGLTWDTKYLLWSPEVNSFEFIDENTGYAACNNYVYKTTDGGNSWNINFVPYSGADFNDVKFPTQDTGYAIGEHDFYKTTDGGNSWNCFFENYYFIGWKSFFLSADTGFIIGITMDQRPMIYRTTDGGDTCTIAWQGPQTGVWLLSITFSDHQHGFVTGSQGTFLTTDDGGQTWQYQNMNGYDLSMIKFSGKYGYMSGGSSLGNVLYKSFDYGNTWNEFIQENNFSVFDLADSITGIFSSVFSESPIRSYTTLFSTNDGGISFMPVSSGSRRIIKSIRFPSDDTGYCVCDSGIVLKTTNEGASWTTLFTGILQDFSSCSFPDNSVGYVASTQGMIIKTTDGGTSWDTCLTGYSEFSSVFFTDENNGWAGAYDGSILKTTNGGVQWDIVYNQPGQKICDIYFITPETGFASGYPGLILKTEDAGVTWENVGPSTNISLWSICFVDQNVGFMLSGPCKVYKTTSGGDYWFKFETPFYDYASSIFFIDENTGYISGPDGMLLLSTDGGLIWHRQESHNWYDLNSLFITQARKGFVAGDYGAILSTGDICVGIANAVPEKHLTVYPNPSSDHVNVDLSQFRGPVLIGLSDLNGRELFNTVSENTSFDLDVSSLKPGMYLLKVKAGEKRVVKKIVVYK